MTICVTARHHANVALSLPSRRRASPWHQLTKRTTFASMQYSKANLPPIPSASLCKAPVMMVVMVAAVLGEFGCDVYDPAGLGPTLDQGDAGNPDARAADSSPSGEGECGGGVCWWSRLHDGCASA